MEKENIDSVSFNLYDGQRSEYATFTLKEEFERFSFGDWFGCDGQTLWISEDDRTAEFQEELDEDPGKEELAEMLYEILNQF